MKKGRWKSSGINRYRVGDERACPCHSTMGVRSEYYFCFNFLFHLCFGAKKTIFFIRQFSLSPIDYQPSPKTLINIKRWSSPPKYYNTSHIFCIPYINLLVLCLIFCCFYYFRDFLFNGNYILGFPLRYL